MVKRIVRLLPVAVLISALAIPFSPAIAQEGDDWVGDGDKVYVDDSNVYLSATPHTLKGSGWIEFELNSKQFSGEIDAVWGFESSAGIVPSQPQLWTENVAHEMERWIDVERASEITLDGVTSYEVLIVGSEAPDIGNENNTKLIRVGISDEMGDYSFVIAYNSYVQHSASSATFYYNYAVSEKEYYTEYYDDYQSMNLQNFTKVDYNYFGVDDWQFVKLDAAIQVGITYKMRVWVDVPFTGLTPSPSKFVWAVKPSNETIGEARTRGHLYVLDPWLDGGWDQRVEITIDSSNVDAALANFPVLIYISAASGQNPDDISFIFDELVADANRFKIAVTEDDGETELYVEIEKWDDAGEEAWLWVGVPNIANGADTTLYLYFDIDHADNVAFVGDSNSAVAENVWDSNFVLVDHMQDDPDNAHTRDSTQYDNDGTKLGANEPIEVAGQVGDAQDYDMVNDRVVVTAVATIANVFDGGGKY